ncbi:unnamed protein product [Gemmataceae bacterium]|nr:unnamed protein product [Gemmataceae bacterium]VTT99903.1 unnamed protein product [Gemmataceae bacterium]
MAKGRGGRGPSRLDRRRESEAVEAREKEETEEAEVEEEAEEEADAEAEAESGDDDEAPKKKAKKPAKKAAAAKKPAAKRTRVAKEVRRRAVWVVCDNGSKEVGEFPFNQKAEAEELLARKIQEKEGKATFYLNLVKKEMKE